jgi:hypothetical protein
MRHGPSVLVGRFVTFRAKDGHFHFRFLGADGADLLLSVPFDTPQQAGNWIGVLDKAGGASSFVWGRQGLHLEAGEHVGGHACTLWYGDERLAESGPFASADDCEAALRHLVAELEARWRSLQAG